MSIEATIHILELMADLLKTSPSASHAWSKIQAVVFRTKIVKTLTSS